MINRLHCIDTEWPKTKSALFSASATAIEQTKDTACNDLLRDGAHIDNILAESPLLPAAQLRVADAYLFTVAN